jgi:hypothetical protein
MGMRASIFLVCCLLSFMVGCGSESERPVPAGGRVTLGGNPVEGAMVTFNGKNGGRSASGKTDKDGKFKLSSIDTDDGAVPGEFIVTIFKMEAKGGAAATNNPKNPSEDYVSMMKDTKGDLKKMSSNTLPAKYADATQSGVFKTVLKGEPNNFNIDL